MTIRSWARACERRFLRPIGRLLPRGGWTARAGRIAGLERRIDELERLVRELAGLAYLELDRPAGPEGVAEGRGPDCRAATPQEAA